MKIDSGMLVHPASPCSICDRLRVTSRLSVFKSRRHAAGRSCTKVRAAESACCWCEP